MTSSTNFGIFAKVDFHNIFFHMLGNLFENEWKFIKNEGDFPIHTQWIIHEYKTRFGISDMYALKNFNFLLSNFFFKIY